MDHNDTDQHRRIALILGYKYQKDSKYDPGYYVWVAPDGEEFSHETAREVCEFYEVHTLEDANSLVEKGRNISISKAARESQNMPFK